MYCRVHRLRASYLFLIVTLLITSVPAPVWAAADVTLSTDWLTTMVTPPTRSVDRVPLPAFESPLAPPTSPAGNLDPIETPTTPPKTLNAGEIITGTIPSRRDTSLTVDEVTTIRFSRGAVRETAEVEITRLERLPAPLPRGVQFKGYGLDVEIRERGGQERLSRMEQPATIVMRYAGLPGVGNATSQQLLKLYHYDGKRGAWQVLPTRVSPREGMLTATTSSFSPVVLGSDTETTLGDFANPWAPTVQDFQVDMFTGAATWAVPIDVPVGRGGLAPNLALSYNSGIIDETHGDLNPQASWVGAGWNLEVGYIARQIVRDGNNTPTAVSTYTLVLNGVSSELISTDGKHYHTKDERYWRIERIPSGADNRGGDYWLVTTLDGTQYRFGYEDETAGDDSAYSAWWMVTPVSPTNPDFRYTNWRWNLDQIKDTRDNYVHLRYEAEHNDFVFLWKDGHAHFYTGEGGVRPCGGSYGPCVCDVDVNGQTYEDYICHDYMAGEDYQSGYVVGGHLHEITYSKHESAGAAPAYQIDFVANSRDDYPDGFDSDIHGTQDVQTFWSKHRLQAIKFRDTSGHMIRKYELEHDYLSWANDSHHMLILNGVWQFNSGEGQSLQPTRFSYNTDLPCWYDASHGTEGGAGRKPWLQTVYNGYGGSVAFEYRMVGGFQDGRIHDPNIDSFCYWFRYRVRQVTASPGIGPQMVVEYRYCEEGGDCASIGASDGDWDGHEFRGHPRVREIWYEGTTPAAYTDHYFHQGDGAATGNCDGDLVDLGGMEGREYKVISYNGSGNEMARTVTRHDRTLHGEDWQFIYPKAVCRYPAGEGGPKVLTWYHVDDYGNVTTEMHYGDTEVTGDERLVQRAYLDNTAAWIVDRPMWERVYEGLPDNPPAGTEAAMRAWAYDGAALGATPTVGALTMEAAYHTISADWTNPTHYDATYYQHDSWGNVITTTNALNQVSTTEYDDAYRQFALQTCAAVGTLLERCTELDYYGVDGVSLDGGLFGQVKQVTDAKGAVTAFRYDTFGRLTTVRAADDAGWDAGQVTARYEYLDLGNVGQQRIVAWNGRDTTWSETYFDGMGRTVQAHQKADGGQEVRTTTEYDALGRVKKEWPPSLGTPSHSYTAPAGDTYTTTYDALGRVIRVDHPDGTHDEADYDTWTMTAVDANSHQKRYTENALGQTVMVEEFTGVYTDNPTIYASTSYEYNTLGNLTDVWDADDNHIQMWYDALGRKTKMDDPDMGVWEYDYNALGNLKWQQDAKGQTLVFEYDALNRLTKKCVGEGGGGVWACGNETLAEYGYDAGEWGIGHRTSMVDATGTTTWDYDVRGRVTAEMRNLANNLGTYTTEWRYDAADRMTAMRYPNGEVVRTAYDGHGLVESVIGYSGGDQNGGSDQIWAYLQNATYNALSQVTEMRFGNGVTTDYTYNEQSFRLARIRTSNPVGDLLDLRYTYDKVGNVTSLNDATRGETHAFGYDELDRLTSGSASLDGGGTLYDEQYTYDLTGNIDVRDGVDYDYLDGDHVHAVTHLGGGERYWYDASGSMTQRISGGVTYLQAFDVENRLAVVTNTTTGAVTAVGYDGDGHRVWQSNGITTTVYIGDLMEVTTGPADSVTRLYYYAGNQRIAMRVLDGSYASLYYLHGDHLGSTSLATHGQIAAMDVRAYFPVMMRNATGSGVGGGGSGQPLQPTGPAYVSPGAPEAGTAVVGSETRYMPYGEVRTGGQPVAGLTDFTYTGQQVDGATGLMFYNARWYDPYLSRWISPDTIVPDPANPQSLNRFSYTLGNPLKYVDPSGHYLADPDTNTVYTAGHWSNADEEYFTSLEYNIVHGEPLDSFTYSGDEYGDWARPLITRNNPWPSAYYGLTFDQLPPRDQQARRKLRIGPAEWDRENLGNDVGAVRDLAMTSEDPILWVSVGAIGAVKYGPGVVQAGKEGLALAGMECMKNPLCAGMVFGVPTDGKIEIHSVPHPFPLIGRARHIQIMLWHPGVKGSHWIIRIPIP